MPVVFDRIKKKYLDWINSMSLQKKLLFSAIICFGFVLFSEMVARSILYARHGQSEFALNELAKQARREVLGFWINQGWDGENLAIMDGVELNKRAWQATFDERGLVPSYSGPREGFWGAALTAGEHDSERIDIEGDVQEIVSGNGSDVRILILGGSVAMGAYATSEETTYFGQLGRMLEEGGIQAHIRVIANGALTSNDELSHLISTGFDFNPDFVIMLNGLNDLFLLTLKDERKLKYYESNMRNVAKLCQERGVHAVFAPQPSIMHKPLSLIEIEILRRTVVPPKMLPLYESMCASLRDICDDYDATFVDAHLTFSKMKETTFTDVWHFTDPGHEALAQVLRDALYPNISKPVVDTIGFIE